MAFHKYGIYSFQVGVQRMVVVGGNNFVADITALRRHGLSGAAEIVDLPIIDEQYGETAREAEGLAVKAMGEWIDRNLPLLEKRPAVSDVSDSR
jgi:hypothetical protein